MRSKQHLVAVRPEDKVLALETMFFSDEVRDPTREIGSLPGDLTFKPREIDTAKLLIDSMSAEWNPENYSDTYRERGRRAHRRQAPGRDHRHRRRSPSAGAGRRPHGRPPGLGRGGPPPSSRQRQGLPSGPGQRGEDQGRPQSQDDGQSHRRHHAPPSKRQARARAGAPARAAAEDLSALSKAELAKRAADLGIEGRSKMTRDELESALTATATPTSARRRKAS